MGFLANEDPAARKYAEWTMKSCQETGVDFSLVKVDKESLEQSILKANEDKSINGIMVYYPVFGNHHDLYLQNRIHHLKDVEGLGQIALKNLYQNKRFFDTEKSMKTIIPCTPLAILKVPVKKNFPPFFKTLTLNYVIQFLEYIEVYNPNITYGTRLVDKKVTIINRSEIVGRPLAALLANEGAKVFSIDAHNVQTFTELDANKTCQLIDTDLNSHQVIPQSDIVVTGVPNPNYKVPTELLKEGAVAINFSTFANFEPNVKSKVSYFVPSVGKVTVAMLVRNLLRLYDYQQKVTF